MNLKKQAMQYMCIHLQRRRENKTLDTVQDVYEYLIENHFDRNDCLVALGGGVVGDLTDFLRQHILEGLNSYRFLHHFLRRLTQVLAARQALISGHIRIWLEHSISQSLYI